MSASMITMQIAWIWAGLIWHHFLGKDFNFYNEWMLKWNLSIVFYGQTKIESVSDYWILNYWKLITKEAKWWMAKFNYHGRKIDMNLQKLKKKKKSREAQSPLSRLFDFWVIITHIKGDYKETHFFIITIIIIAINFCIDCCFFIYVLTNSLGMLLLNEVTLSFEG